ncbi:MAG: GNAT family N-acetyltransferase, partial [Bradymonadia bacterium]
LLTITTVFVLSSMYCVWWLSGGCAHLCGAHMSAWAGFGLRDLDSEELRRRLLDSRWADPRYLPPFLAQIDYLNSLSTPRMSWMIGSTQSIPFAGGVLHPWSTNRMDECLSVLCDEELMRWHALQAQEESIASRLVTYAGAFDQHRSFWSYMLLNDNEEVCGHVELRMIGHCGHVAELSFGLRAAFRRHGYMSNALKALISHWQNKGEPRDYIARTKSTNRACIGLLEALGFRRDSSYIYLEELGPTTGETVLFVLKRDVTVQGLTD